jgi:hypothetical protein
MYMYLRVIHETLQDSVSVEQRLRECFTCAPGVARVIKIEPHVRGGYSVTFDLNGTIGEVISHVETSGYRGVL